MAASPSEGVGGPPEGPPGGPPPLDVECEYLLVPQLHFPDFVAPHLLAETAEQHVRLLELLGDPEGLRGDPGKVVFAMHLARVFESTATAEALSLEDNLKILIGWKQLLMGPLNPPGCAEGDSVGLGCTGSEETGEETDEETGCEPFNVSLAGRLCETFAAALNNFQSRFVSPYYLKPSSRYSFLQLERACSSSSSSCAAAAAAAAASAAAARAADDSSSISESGSMRAVGPKKPDAVSMLQQLRQGLWQWLLLRLLHRYCRSLAAPVETGSAKRRAFVSSLVRLADASRFLWEEEQQQQALTAAAAAAAGDTLLLPWQGEEETVNMASLPLALTSLLSGLDNRRNSLSLRARLLLLFSSGANAHRLISQGHLFRSWRCIDGSSLATWDSVFLAVLRRGCKYGWAVGNPLCCLLRPLLPFLLQIALRSFAVNGKGTAAAQQLRAAATAVPGELSPLLSSRLETPKLLAKTLALLLEPSSSSSSSSEVQASEAAAAAKAASDAAAGVDRATAAAGGDPLETGGVSAAAAADTPRVLTAFELLEVLVKTVGPWTHPQTETHRGALNIATFLTAFVSAYLRRVQRERLGSEVTAEGCGRHLNGCCALQQQQLQQQQQQQNWCCCNAAEGQMRCSRLTRKDDERIADLLVPVLLDGLFSKHPQTAACFEEGLRSLLHLVPERSLERFLERALQTLETVTDANQTQAIEMLTRAAHAIVKFAPSMLPPLLEMTLQGIDPADPLKTFITLSFHSVLFSYIPMIDCSSVSSSLSDEQLAALLADPDAPLPPSLFGCTDTAAAARLSACSSVLPAAAAAAQKGVRCVPCVSEALPGDGDSSSASKDMSKKGKASVSSAALLPWDVRFKRDISFARELIQQRGSVSSLLPEWALEWLRRVLSLVEVASKPDEKSTGLMGRVDRGTYLAIRAAGQSLFCHVSEETAAELRDTFVSWAATPHPEAVRQAGSLALALAAAAPQLLLPSLLELTEKRILEETPQKQQQQQEEIRVCGVSVPQGRLKASLSVGTADWHLRLLCSSVRAAGPLAVPFQQRLLSLAHAALRHHKREIYRLGGKLLRRCIETWAGVYPWRLSHCRCMGTSEWRDTARRQLFVLRWGAPFWIKRGGEEIEWHVPTREELAAAETFAVYGRAAAQFLLLPLLPGDTPPESLLRDAAAALCPVEPELNAAADALLPQETPAATEAWLPTLEGLADVRALPADFLGFLTEEEERPVAAAAAAAAAGEETPEKGDSRRRARLTRALKLCRLLAKAAAAQQADERPRRCPMWSVVTPYEQAPAAAGTAAAAAAAAASSSSTVSPFRAASLVDSIASLLLVIARTQLPLPEGPLVSHHIAAAAKAGATGTAAAAAAGKRETGDTTEEAKMLKRFLKVSRQLLVRPFTSWVFDAGRIGKENGAPQQAGFDGEGVEILSSCCGIHESGFLHDVPRCVWVNGVCNAWGARLSSRRMHVGLEGWRQLLLLVTLNLAAYHYAESRSLAQQILRETFSFFTGIRSFVLKILLQLLETNAQQLPTERRQVVPEHRLTVPTNEKNPPMTDNGGTQTPTDGVADAIGPSSVEATPRFPSSPNTSSSSSCSSTAEALQHARLTGVVYMLNSFSMIRRLWRDPLSLSRCLRSVLSVLSLKLERSTVHQRWAAFANAVLTQREKFSREHPKYEQEIVKDLLGSTLDWLSSAGKASPVGSSAPHWRSVLVGGAFCVCFNSPPVSCLLPAYSRWLLAAADAALQPPMITTVAAFGLFQLLHFLKTNKELIPPEFLVSLHSPQTVQRLLHSLVSIHHENIRGAQGAHESSSSSRAGAAQDSSFPIVATVLKLDSTWPDTRAPRASRLLSLHNMLYAETLLKFLYATQHLMQQQQQQQQQQDMEVDGAAVAAAATATYSFPQLLQQGLAPVLQCLFKAPNNELEKHIAATEIAAAAAAAAGHWEDPEARNTLWQILCPLMSEDFSQLDDDRVAAWADGLRFALSPRQAVGPCIQQQQEQQQEQQQQQERRAAAAAARSRIIPFANFFVDAQKASNPTETLLCVPTADLGASSSGDLTRQLRLYYALVSVSVVFAAPRCSSKVCCNGSSSCSCCCGCCFAAAALAAGEEALLRCFAHPYKQVREEVARLTITAITSCDAEELLQQETDGLLGTGRVSSETAAAAAAAAAAPCSCSCNPTQVAQRLRLYIHQQAAAVLKSLAEAEGHTATEREAGKSRSPALCASLTLLNCITALAAKRDGKTLASLGAAGSRAFEVYVHLTTAAADQQQQQQQTDGVLLALVLAASKHPDCDISSHGMHAAHYCCLVQQQRQLLTDMLQQQLGATSSKKCLLLQQRDIVSSLVSYMRHPSWRVRAFIPALLELDVTQHRFLLCGDVSYKMALAGGLQGLADAEANVRAAAKTALTPLLLSLSTEDCRFYSHVFIALAGPAFLRCSSPSVWCRPVGGVSGLVSLVSTAPYDVPPWLPETITALAQYANTTQPDVIRREVERALQDFFKTHQEGWEGLHRAAFSEEQLDVLDTYKGRPTYFA